MMKLPDFGPKLYFRVANCYFELGKKWEAVVVYDDLLLRFPSATTEERESAAFAQIAILTDTASAAEVGRVCDQYLKDFPEGKNRDTVVFFKNTSLAAAEMFEEEEKGLEAALKKATTETKYRAEMTFHLGYAQFMQG